VRNRVCLRSPTVAWITLLLVVAGPSVAQQRDNRPRATSTDHAVEFYISENALQAQYVRMIDLGEIGPTEVRGGFFYNEDGDLIGMGDLLMDVGAEVEARRFELRFGTRLYGAFLAPEDEDVFSIGIGGEAEYFFNQARTVSAKVGLFYSPDIVTFGSADNVKDVSLRLMAQMRDGTDVFVGFRVFEMDLPIDREVDDNVHVGFRRSF
jgi:hypothetical protein